jgi:hypothetical protein
MPLISGPIAIGVKQNIEICFVSTSEKGIVEEGKLKIQVKKVATLVNLI